MTCQTNSRERARVEEEGERLSPSLFLPEPDSMYSQAQTGHHVSVAALGRTERVWAHWALTHQIRSGIFSLVLLYMWHLFLSSFSDVILFSFFFLVASDWVAFG